MSRKKKKLKYRNLKNAKINKEKNSKKKSENAFKEDQKQKQKANNNTSKQKDDLSPLERAKEAYNRKYNHHEKGWENKAREDIENSLKKMSKQDKESFYGFLEKDLSPKMATGDLVKDTSAYIRNKDIYKNIDNPEFNPMAYIDEDFTSRLKYKAEDEILKIESQFNSKKSKLFDEKGKVKDYGEYGEIYNILSDKNILNDEREILAHYLGIDNANILSKNMNKKQKKDFIEKTFKGDSNDPESVTKYLEDIKDFLEIEEGTEMFDSIKDIVEKDGNRLKKRYEAEQKVIKREKARQENKKNTEGTTKSANKKEQKVSNKARQKEIDKIRRYTGTEGGTLTDFFKGSRGNFLNVGMSVVGAVSEFKEGRNEGKTILGSATDATLSFAVTEMLGMRATIGLMAAKGITNLAAIGTKYALNSSRSMNNIQRFSPFADAQFQDTQQLATMRQSGMELAKMSQYNLQQTLMGTEARNLHR